VTGIKQFEIFNLVVENQSFTRAAKILFMSQPAISWQIKRLEEDLGVPLFIRREKELELTEAGEVFFQASKQICGIYRQTCTTIASYSQLKWGHLIIGASTIPGEYILPSWLPQFHKKYNNLNINIIIGPSGEIIEKLINNEIDIAMVGAKLPHQDIKYYPWLEDEIIMVGSSDMPSKIKAEDLKKYILIKREEASGTQMVINKALANVGLNESFFAGTLSIASNNAIISLVKKKAGVAFISHFAADEAILSGKVKRIRVPKLNIKRHFYIVLRNDDFLPPPLKVLKDNLLSQQTTDIAEPDTV